MRAKVELAEGIPGARLEVVPASGHATPLDAPEAFNDLLLRFLSEVDQTPQAA
jgi:pimeloyl-ACP methyl ester carboxylesterase